MMPLYVFSPPLCVLSDTLMHAQASDLRRLMNKYAEWAHILVPNMEFT